MNKSPYANYLLYEDQFHPSLGLYGLLDVSRQSHSDVSLGWGFGAYHSRTLDPTYVRSFERDIGRWPFQCTCDSCALTLRREYVGIPPHQITPMSSPM